jgi:hypothetical protein
LTMSSRTPERRDDADQRAGQVDRAVQPSHPPYLAQSAASRGLLRRERVGGWRYPRTISRVRLRSRTRGARFSALDPRFPLTRGMFRRVPSDSCVRPLDDENLLLLPLWCAPLHSQMRRRPAYSLSHVLAGTSCPEPEGDRSAQSAPIQTLQSAQSGVPRGGAILTRLSTSSTMVKLRRA